MSKRLFKLVSALLAGLMLSGLTAIPAHAAGPAKLQQCIDASTSDLDRSQCYWEHWQYMASYGR